MPSGPEHGYGEILLYETEDGRTRVECRFADETLWMSQALMAELFQKDVRTINEHLKNLVEEGEIDPRATIREFRIVRREGHREITREIEHYSLDAILASDLDGGVCCGLRVVGGHHDGALEIIASVNRLSSPCLSPPSLVQSLSGYTTT